MRDELTPRQKDVMQVLGACAREGFAPVVADIASRLGLKAINSVVEHLDELKRKGFVRVEGGVRGRQRQIVLTDRGQWQVGLRFGVLGCIPAGAPVEVLQEKFDSGQESLGGWLAQQMGTHPGDFFLKVSGDSMIGDGIHDGDFVLIRPTFEARDGEIAAVAVGDERCATLKRVFLKPETGEVELHREAPRKPPCLSWRRNWGVVQRTTLRISSVRL